MGDKIEVGEYVRTKNGEIGKIIVDKDNPLRYVINEYGQIELHTDIVKHSKNITKLIKPGDYVNGELVEEIICNDDEFEITTTTEYLTNIEDIKSIVTHEMFEIMKYRI